jgi:DNA polymerase IV
VARTKHLAKVASQVAKPDGLVAVDPAEERDFLDPLPIRLIWGVGPTTERRLHEAGIHTVGQLAATGSPILGNLLGNTAGAKLRALSANIDARTVQTPARSKSMGAQAALGRRQADPELVRETLGYLGDRVAGRLRKANLAGRTVTVRVRFAHLRAVTRSSTLPVAISTTLTLIEVAEQLARSAIADNRAEREITLLAVSVSNLRPEHSLQLELPLDLADPPQIKGQRHHPRQVRPHGRWVCHHRLFRRRPGSRGFPRAGRAGRRRQACIGMNYNCGMTSSANRARLSRHSSTVSPGADVLNPVAPACR